MAFFSGGHSTRRYRPDCRDLDEQLDEVAQGDRFGAADVERLAVAGVGGAGAQERVGGVIDVDEVAELAAVAVNLDLAVLDRMTDEPADEALAVVLEQLTRSVHVREPQRAGADAEDVVVDQMVVLAGGLVDAVHVGGPDQMRLGHRQRVRTAVDLSRPGEDDLHAGVVAAAGLEQRQLAAAVDLQIRVRILHAVDVAHLTGEVEDHILAAHEIVHRALLPDVGDVHRHAVLDAAGC